jgi:steroid delta-isomerase-like uncharacterized protein
MASKNVDLAERFHFEVFQKGNLDAANDILTKDFVAHSPGLPPELSKGPEGAKSWAQAIRTGLPDISLSHEDIVSEGDKVTIRWTGSGTHDGEMFGVPATGRPVNVSGIDIFLIKGGKIAEMWQEWDALGFMQQVGAIPSP